MIGQDGATSIDLRAGFRYAVVNSAEMVSVSLAYPVRRAVRIGSPGEITPSGELLLWEVLRVESRDEIGTAVLCAGAKRIVARIRRHVSSDANVHNLGLFSQYVDDLPYQIPPHTEPSEHLFVLGKNVLGDQPFERRPFNPVAKKFGAWVPRGPSGFES
jgi:hypothetical protein